MDPGLFFVCMSGEIAPLFIISGILILSVSWWGPKIDSTFRMPKKVRTGRTDNPKTLQQVVRESGIWWHYQLKWRYRKLYNQFVGCPATVSAGILAILLLSGYVILYGRWFSWIMLAGGGAALLVLFKRSFEAEA